MYTLVIISVDGWICMLVLYSCLWFVYFFLLKIASAFLIRKTI